MKITFLLTWADAMGGTERAVFTQAAHLAARHDVEVLSVFRTRERLFFDVDVPVRFLIDQTGPVPRPVRESALDDETCRALAASRSRLIDPRWEKAFNRLSDIELERALGELDADVVVSTSPALMAVTTTLTPPATAKVHQEHRPSQLRGGTGEPLFQFAPRLDALVVLTERTKEWFAETMGECAPRLAVIVNALPGGFRPRSTRMTRTVTIARRLVADKQVDHAIRAFAKVAGGHPDWVLRIFGDGPEEARLRRLVGALNLHDNVQILGPTGHMTEEWAKTSVALLTSQDGEAFPLVLMEAFAAGVPAVAYDCQTGPAEIITDGEDGFLVGQGDIDGLAHALRRLIADDELRHSFGESALRSARRYDAETVMAQWEDLYASLLTGRDDPTDRIAAWAARTGGSGFAPAVPPPARRLTGDAAALEATMAAGMVRSGGRLSLPADDLVSTDVTRANLELVCDALEGHGVPHVLLRDPGQRHRVVVRAEHRPAALTALARTYADRPVYAERLRPGGKPSGVTLAALAETAAGVAGLRVFQQVVTSSRTLIYGPAYGCDLEFWEETGGDLVALRPTLLGGTVPAEVLVPDARMRVGGRDHPAVSALDRLLVDDLDFPVDVVYTWVDGQDPAWTARRDAALAELGRPPAQAAAGAARFRSRDELRYSLRSLEMFAPWVRRVWIVTDGQTPSWLDTAHPDVTVVDHKEIFADPSALPTFNSHAIESQLHHIDGLAEHFLYFNDDMCLGRPVEPAQFFHPNGMACFFRSPTPVAPTPVSEADDFNFAAAKNNRGLIEEAFGRTLTHAFLHAPYPLRRGVLAEIEERFAADVARTARSRFRSGTDISVASSLHHYYGYLTGGSAPGAISVEYVDVGDAGQHPKLTQLLTRRHRDAFCLNDTHHGRLDPEEQARIVFAFLEGYLPVASGFERGSARAARR